MIIGQGARKCWRGEVGTQPVPVRITVAMETGRTKLGFYTPTHGVAEGASAGARALAFALYDPKIIFAGDAP